jgi:1-aminocyclopropane-1-carboxylate deaminase
LEPLSYSASPVIEWKDARLPVKVVVKLEYLNHPYVSGNKWWKLKYNLAEAQRRGFATLLTFGGAYSNHIFATAAAAHELRLKSIGIIRGEAVSNPTLDFAQGKGMTLHFVSREDYRSKTQPGFISKLVADYGAFYLIPEGGSNELAVKGCIELGTKLQSEIFFDTICLPVGTGGTMAGIISAMDTSKRVLGFSGLKGPGNLPGEVEALTTKQDCSWEIIPDYHFGGYAKRNPVLDDFIDTAKKDHGLDLDPVYTSKMMFGVLDLARKGKFKKGSTILVLHTGGLQAGLV